MTLSPAAAAAIDRRKHVEAGIRTDDDVAPHGAPIVSNYFDLAQIMDYWGPRRLNHHTEATSMLYGGPRVRAAAREEGMADGGGPARAARRARCWPGCWASAWRSSATSATRCTTWSPVRIPDAVDGDAVRGALLDDFGIEIGTSFGPLHGKVWRIGTMGYNARRTPS